MTPRFLRGTANLLVGVPEKRPGFSAMDGEALSRELAQVKAPVRLLPRAVAHGNATRNVARKGSRRPDKVVVRSPGLEPRGKDIRAVIEVKTKDTGWRRGQKVAYERIAGGRKRLLVLDDETCQCSPPPAPPPAIPGKRGKDVDAKKTAEKATAVRKKRPEPVVALRPLAVLVGAAAAIGTAIAIVATAPVAAAAAAAVALIAVSSGSSRPAGGDDAI